MSDKSKIEWTDTTWNPIRGCSRVSDGCRNCYAENIANRFCGEGQPYQGLIKHTSQGPKWNGNITFVEKVLTKPLRWKKPRRIFVNSMSDLFHENVKDEWIDQIFAVMLLSQNHTFQILTKRPERMQNYITNFGRRVFDCAIDYMHLTERNSFPAWPYKNVWLGVSIEDQKTAEERIPYLFNTPAHTRFVSAEPLLGKISLDHMSYGGWPMDALNGVTQNTMEDRHKIPSLDWVIVGGESGPNARPMHPEWARNLRDQCAAANTPFFFKQWGEWRPWEEDAQPPYFNSCTDKQTIDGHHLPEMDDPDIKDWCYDLDHFIGSPPRAVCYQKVGKKTAGQHLDGVLHQQYPPQHERTSNGKID